MKASKINRVTLQTIAIICGFEGVTVGSRGAEPSFVVGNTPGFPGVAVSVPISPRNATNAVGGQFDLMFNTNKAFAGTAVPGPSLRYKVRSREIAPGVRRVVAYSLGNTAFTNRAVALVPFTLPQNEYTGSGPIAPANILLARRDGTRLAPVTGVSGQVFARPANRSPDGTVQFFLPSQPDTRYLIQATTDFVHWLNLTNTTALGGFMDLIDADALNYPFRFYRSVQVEGAGEFTQISNGRDGSIQLQLKGQSGRTYTLQASTNLVDWADIDTRVATAGTTDFGLPNEGVYRFFRIRSD